MPQNNCDLEETKAVQAAGTDEAKAVMAQMKKLSINGFMTKDGRVREESKGPWDMVKMIATVPGNEAFRPLEESGCPLVTKK